MFCIVFSFCYIQARKYWKLNHISPRLNSTIVIPYLEVYIKQIFHYITLHNFTLHYITLHYITSHHITSYYIALHDIALRTLHYKTINYTTLHFITLQYITLLYITLHCCPAGRRAPFLWPRTHRRLPCLLLPLVPRRGTSNPSEWNPQQMPTMCSFSGRQLILFTWNSSFNS